MSGFDTLTALLRKPDPRPDLFEQLRNDSEYIEDMPAGAAIAACAAMWLAERWPAMLIGAVAGMLGLAIPALIVARLLR